MSYQVLARKWRPQSFQEVIGQPHVLTALENGLAQNRVHHAYLFSGTRGVGKTTIARLLAKSLNCETGVTSTPCGQCANCQAIDQGRFVDLLEIDAASRTKVDDTRELLDNVQYKPAQGRYKVYLIDEVHMLSKHSFNALLKTLEEPPEYVKFLLATTDPQKLPITVLSRCLQFHLKAILPEQIEQQLADILTQEHATFDQPALTVIAKAADGSMRDALSLTDQALAFGAGHIEYNAVLKMLGTIDQSHLYYLLHFIASGNSQKVFEKIQEFVHLGADFSALHQELATLCHQIALAQLQLNANVVKKTAVQLLAERLTPEEVQLFYQIAVQGYKDYSYAPNGKVALEMTVMRLLAFKPANYVDIDEAMLAQSEQVESIEVEQPLNQAKSALKEPLTADSQVNHKQPETAPENHAQVEVTESSVMHQGEQTQTNLSEADNVVASNNASEAMSESTHAQVNTPSLESSNSRNMLRSHRLKREALKKTEAATEQAPKEDEQFVAPVKKTAVIVDSTTSSVEEKKDKPVIDSLPVINKAETPSQENNVSELNTGVVNSSFDNGQELPPLTSYQDQQSYTEQYESSNDAFDDPRLMGNNHTLESENIIQSEPLVNNGVVHNEVSLNAPDETQYLPYANKNPEKVVEVEKENSDISTLHQAGNLQTNVHLEVNVNLESAEVDIAGYVEGKMTDPWFLAIQEMHLVGFEKLLAKSSVMQQQGKRIVLTLHEPQQHLINNQNLCEQLKVKLHQYYGEGTTVDIQVGKVEGSHTPIELEMIVYQEYLDNAKSSIKNDPIVKTLVQDYAAKVYENSVVPL